MKKANSILEITRKEIENKIASIIISKSVVLSNLKYCAYFWSFVSNKDNGTENEKPNDQGIRTSFL